MKFEHFDEYINVFLLQTLHFSLLSSHDRVLVDFCSWRENLPADMGQTNDGHNSRQQPLHQQQVQHSRSQGHILFLFLFLQSELSRLLSSGIADFFFIGIFCNMLFSMGCHSQVLEVKTHLFSPLGKGYLTITYKPVKTNLL